jgi:hypothetical protein
VGRVLGQCIQVFLFIMADAADDRQYMEAIQARIKQQSAQRAAKEARLGSASEQAQLGSSDTALGKRPAFDLGSDPGWVRTFSQDEYNELGRQMTKLKSDYDEKELDCQRKLTDLRTTHEEAMTDSVANAVVLALTAQSLKRAETMDVLSEAMASVDNMLKSKAVGSQKMARGLVRGLNPNLVTRHTLRKVCHTFKDLYQLLEVSFSAVLPDMALLEKDRLSKERLADFFRVNLCTYAGSCISEAEEDFCSSAFGMKLYKAGDTRMYLTEAAAKDKGMDWVLDDGEVDKTEVPIPPSASTCQLLRSKIGLSIQ